MTEACTGIQHDNGVRFHWNTRIPLSDGVLLSSTLYLPDAAAAPCILTMSPYSADRYHALGLYFARNGFAFAAVDVRGRGNSEGVFSPRIQEAQDCYDIIEWLAAQPFCDGQVSMRGASYCAQAQWNAIRRRPPHLRTIVPTAAPFSGVDVPFRGNVFSTYSMRWLTLVGGETSQFLTFEDRRFWAELFHRWRLSRQSFRDLDQFAGGTLPLFQEWLDHPEPDAYWDAQNPSNEDYAGVEIPVLTITGAYDGDQLGALEHYRRHLQNAAAGAVERHFLVIGPWDHAGAARPNADVGGLRIGAEGLLDLPKLHLDWFRWIMSGGARPTFLQNRVAYYVMGAEEWAYANDLADVTKRHEALFLDSDGSANSIFSSGLLSARGGKGSPDSYRYDPRDTSAPEIAAELASSGPTITDQRLQFALDGRQFVFHSEPVTDPIDISGFFELSLWLSIDCPDTDIFASVHLVRQNGTTVRLSCDVIRARYRDGLREPRLIQSVEPLRYAFQRFPFISRRMVPGERLRLVIAPVGRLVDVPFVQPNPNTGASIADEPLANARAVTVRLFHDLTHPSVLRVPIGPAPTHQPAKEST